MPAVQTMSNGVKKVYLSLYKGKFRERVDKGAEQAQVREYVDKEGNTKVIFERVYDGWNGELVGLRMNEGKFGSELKIYFNDAVISIPQQSKEFDDIVPKLASIVFGSKERNIEIKPYDFETEDKNGNEVRMRGATITANGNKVVNYFKQWNDETKKFEYLNGLPKPTGKEKKKDQWKLYFATVNSFYSDKVDEMSELFPKYVHPVQTQQSSLDDIPVVDEIPVVTDNDDTTDYEEKEEFDELDFNDVPF